MLGGGGGVQKKIVAQGKIKWKKFLCMPINPKNIYATAKKNSYKEFDNEKKYLRLKKFPTPPKKFF